MRHPLNIRAVRMIFATVLVLTATQPARAELDRILGEVTIATSPGCTSIRIGFDVPILYLRHFPYESGETLLVFVRPLGSGPQGPAIAFQRETASIPPSEFTGLSEIMFEGDAPAGAYLSITFTRRLSFDVRQGRDYRSIDVFVSDPGASQPCQPDL